MLHESDAESGAKEQIKGELRRLHAQNKPLNLTAAKNRYPELVQAVYAVQPYWGWKSAVEEAGLTYTHLNTELLDFCTCELCGHDAKILTGHLRQAHGMTAADYRHDWPQADIMCETLRADRFRPSGCIPHWEPLWSYEYALDRLKELGRRGFPMNFEWANREEKGLAQYLWHTHHAWDDCLRVIGLQPERIRLLGKARRLTKQEIILGLQERHRQNLPLSHAQVMLEDLRLYNAARRSFGSYEAALIAAQLSPDEFRRKKRNFTPEIRTQVMEALRQVAAMHGSERAKAALEMQVKYQSYVFRHLGNWSEAARAAGVPSESVMVSERYNPPRVITELRAWKAQGGELSASGLRPQNGSLYIGALKCFGTFSKAVSAAGLAMDTHPRKPRRTKVGKAQMPRQ